MRFADKSVFPEILIVPAFTPFNKIVSPPAPKEMVFTVLFPSEISTM